MGPLPLNLEQLQEHLGELLAELLLGAQLSADQDTSAPIVSAFGQVLQTMSRLDREALRDVSDEAAYTVPRAATKLGESAHRLLNLAVQCLDADGSERGDQLALLHVGFAYWVARHGGTVGDLAALVEHLMHLDTGDSRDTGSTVDLAELTTVMLTLIDSLAPHQPAQTPPADPRDPWRLLHLHVCDTAWRAQRNDLLHQAQACLLRHLPTDVARCGHRLTPRPDITTTEARRDTHLGQRPREQHKPTRH